MFQQNLFLWHNRTLTQKTAVTVTISSECLLCL